MSEVLSLKDGEAQLAADVDLSAPRLFEFAGGQIALITHGAPIPERTNEDAAAVVAVGATSAVFAVADGAGGMPAGGTASRLALEVLLDALKRANPDELRSAILDGIEAANREVLALRNGSATTLVVASIENGIVRTYHAGDSVAVLAGQRGKLKHLTVSHSPTGYAYESGLLDELEAADHPERHLVNNLIGTADLRIEMGPEIPLSPRDTLLLSSDGLLDNLLLEEVLGIACTGPLGPSALDLFQRCRTHMSAPEGSPAPHPDDLSLILFRPTIHSARVSASAES